MTSLPPAATKEPPARLASAVLLASIAWLAIRESGALSIGDVWWHLRTGDLILDSGPPRTDMFSWTAQGDTWRPNAWLGDIVWAGTRSIFGAAAVSLLVGVLVVATALVLNRYCRVRGAGPWAAAGATASALLFLSPFIVPRPLLLGLILVPVVMETAGRFRSGETGGLIWTAAVVVLWANLHGSFVVGVAIVGAMALGWAADERTLGRPALLAIVAVTAGGANPYGFTAYVQTLVNTSESVTIEEWQPLSFGDARGIAIVVFMALTAVVVGAAIRRGRIDRLWEALIPLAGLAVASFAMIRMASFFLLVAAPALAVGLSALRAPGLRRWAAARTAPLAVGVIVAGVVLAVQAAPELSDAGEPTPDFPEDLVAAIPAGCRLLNEYELGGFIIDRRWPDVLVSQDGRADLYGLDRLVAQEEWLSATSVGPIEAQGIDCVITDSGRPLTGVMKNAAGWAVVSEAGGYVLAVKQ